MKKGSKLSYDIDPQMKLKRPIDSKSPVGRSELSFKPQKMAEHRSLEYKNSIGPEKSREEERTDPHQNKAAVRHEYGREEKITQVSRSRSKEKKDRLTLNLAKFTRKNKTTSKEEKTPDSIYLQKQLPAQQLPNQPQQPNSLHSEQKNSQVYESEDFRFNYLEPPSHSGNRRSMFSDEFQSVISQETVEHVDDKPAVPATRKVQPVEYKKVQSVERKRMQHSQAVGQAVCKPVGNDYLGTSSHSLNYPSPQHYQSPRSPENSTRLIEASKKLSSIASQRQQNRVIEDLSAKMQRERQEFNAAINKLQGEKIQLQNMNKQLIENQFSLKNQLQIFKVKNMQLGKDQENAKLTASETGHERDKTVQSLEQALKEMEGRLARTNSELRAKTVENNQLMMQVHQFERECHGYQNELAALQNKNMAVSHELQRQMKMGESQKQEIRNSYEFRLKELSLKQSGSSVEEQKLRAFLSQKQKEVAALKQVLAVRDRRIQELTLDSDDGLEQRLNNQLQSKEAEVDSLIQQLNFNQEKMISLSNELSETTKHYEGELKKKEKEIASLQEQLRESQRAVKNQGLDRRALEQMYNWSEEGSRESSVFLQMQQKQSQQMNLLRSQIASKSQLLHNTQIQNQELKDRIRRAEQQTQMNSRTINANLSNLKQAKDATETVLKAESESLKRKMGSLEVRLGMKDQEIREKNRFIQQHLMGSLASRPDASVLVARLEELTGGKS